VIDDPVSAFFGAALVEPLYGLDRAGRPYPTLAASLPTATARGVELSLRPGLRSARGRSLDARDLLWSLRRSRLGAGRSLLGALPSARAVPDEPLSVVFRDVGRVELARALASPVIPLLPRSFSPRRPDGTGPFGATLGSSQMVLQRNPRAARGAARLESILVRRARDLSEALRRFETGDSDLGWLGAGLHRRLRGAAPFDAGAVGWVVLHTGDELGSWGAPGMARELLQAVAPERLVHLGVQAARRDARPARWAGPATRLLVDRDAPHLVEIAHAVSSSVSTRGHEIQVQPVPRSEISMRSRDLRYGMMLKLTRRIAPGRAGALLSVLTAADPSLARRPPRLEGMALDELTRTLRVGVVGELRLAGARRAELRALDDWQLGDLWKARRS